MSERKGRAALSVAVVVGCLLPALARGERIEPGETKDGEITGTEQERSYSFEALEGQFVTILADGATGGMYPQIDLHLDGPDGPVVASAGAQNYAAIIQAFRLPASGTYCIVVRSYGGIAVGGTGTFAVSYVRNPGPNAPDPDGGTIAPGETKTGTIASGDLDVFDFAGEAGDSVTILVDGAIGPMYPQVDIHGPDGAVVASEGAASYSATIRVCALPLSGTYLIVVRSYGGHASGGTGSYTVSFSREHPIAFIRGDADGSAELNLTDVVVILGYLFLGETGNVRCEDAADADDSGDLNLTDAVFLLDYLFLGGEEIPPPARAPGLDPTGDCLQCS